MNENPFFKPDVYSIQFNFCSDDAFNFTFKFIRSKDGMVVVIKPNLSKIHLTLIIDNNKFESHLTEEGKRKIQIPYTALKVPYTEVEANHFDYEQYEKNLLNNLRDIRPKDWLFYLNNPLQFYKKILSFLLKTKTFFVDSKKTSKGYEIEIKNLVLIGIKEVNLEGIEKLELLETLIIRLCHHVQLPESIGMLKNLKELEISYSNLKSLLSVIGNLSSLEELDLEENELYDLPESIGNLTKLKTINLSGNKIEKLLDSIKKLTQLKIL